MKAIAKFAIFEGELYWVSQWRSCMCMEEWQIWQYHATNRVNVSLLVREAPCLCRLWWV